MKAERRKQKAESTLRSSSLRRGVGEVIRQKSELSNHPPTPPYQGGESVKQKGRRQKAEGSEQKAESNNHPPPPPYQGGESEKYEGRTQKAESSNHPHPLLTKEGS
jgi:hypothetical protein